MSPYCPRCDVHFEKDLPRCPGCGWDFRAHVIPEGFLSRPLDLAPMGDFGRFIRHDFVLIWVNGLAVEILWVIAALVVSRVTYVVLRLVMPGQTEVLIEWVLPIALVVVTILFFPMWANYLFGLLRRYRYRVPVPLLAVLAPLGRSRYAETIAWGLPCLAAGVALSFLLLVPGVVCMSLFVPFLLLIHADKLNISARRRSFILSLAFRRLWLMLLAVGAGLTICWIALVAITLLVPWAGGVLVAFFIPLQSALAVLLYESLLGRVNLDVDE